MSQATLTGYASAGFPVLGGTDNSVLYINGSGLLSSNTSLQFYDMSKLLTGMAIVGITGVSPSTTPFSVLGASGQTAPLLYLADNGDNSRFTVNFEGSQIGMYDSANDALGYITRGDNFWGFDTEVNVTGPLYAQAINGTSCSIEAGSVSIAGYSLNGTNNPCITLKSSNTVRGYAPCVVTGAGSFLTDSAVSDLVYRVEGASNRILFGQGANSSTVSIQNKQVGINTYNPDSSLFVNGTLNSRVVCNTRATSGQSVNIANWQNFSGTNLISISKDGILTNGITPVADTNLPIQIFGSVAQYGVSRTAGTYGLLVGSFDSTTYCVRTVQSADSIAFIVNNATKALLMYPTSAGCVINEDGNDYDFRVESDTKTHMLHVDANGNGGSGSMGIGGTAYASAGATLWVYGDVWTIAAGNIRTLVGESTSFYGSFGWVDSTNIFQLGNSSSPVNSGDQLQFDVNGNVVFNEVGRSVDFRVEGDTNINCLIVDGSADRVGINIAAPLAKFHVQHTSLQQRLSYDASNYLDFAIGSTGVATITSSGSISGFQFTDALGIFLESNLGGTDTQLSAPAYGDYLSLSYDVSLYNGTSTANIVIGGGGSIVLTDSSGDLVTLSGGYAGLYSSSGSQVECTGGAVNINASSGEYIGASWNITLQPATGAEVIIVGMPTSPSSTGALYYDSMTNQVYYNP
jgi:hypothetical protein